MKYILSLLIVSLLLSLLLSSCGSPATPSDRVYIRGKIMRQVTAYHVAVPDTILNNPDSVTGLNVSFKLQTSVLALYKQYVDNGNSLIIPEDSLLDNDVLIPSPATVDFVKNRVRIYIHEKPDLPAGTVFSQVGGLDVIFDSAGSHEHLHQASVAVKQLLDVASLPAVRHISLIVDPIRSSTATDVVHAAEGNMIANLPTHPNISVGVISDDCGSRPSEGLFTMLKSAGKLGVDPVVIADNSQSRAHEGLAMMEVVAQVMPQASIKFATGMNGIPSFINNIKLLCSKGCNVIVDDLLYPNEPAFSDGEIGKAIKELRDSLGLIYISSAGNFAKDVYTFQFSPKPNVLYGTLSTPQYGTAHYSTSSYLKQSFSLAEGQQVKIMLQWDDEFGHSKNDFDLYLVDIATNEIVNSSVDVQAVSRNPIEYLTYEGNRCWGEKGYRIEIVRKERRIGDNPTPRMKIFIQGLDDDDDASKQYSIFGHTCDTNVISCAAMAGDAMVTSVQDYSSLGYAEIVDVKAEVLSDSGMRPYLELRLKPDFCGVDNIPTSVSAFSTFSGTSAAAPVVAGLVALMKASEPMATREQIIQALKNGSIDYEAEGPDWKVGYGRIDVFRCIASLKCIIDETRYFARFTPSRVDGTAASAAGTEKALSIPEAVNGNIIKTYMAFTADGFTGGSEIDMHLSHLTKTMMVLPTMTYTTVNVVVPAAGATSSLDDFVGEDPVGQWKFISSLPSTTKVRNFGVFIIKSP